MSQQTVNAYEAGQRRVPASMLPVLARTLGVSVEELIGEPPSGAARKRGPAPALRPHMERNQRAAQGAAEVCVQVLESVLQQGHSASHR